jgi:hypothetical protein
MGSTTHRVDFDSPASGVIVAAARCRMRSGREWPANDRSALNAGKPGPVRKSCPPRAGSEWTASCKLFYSRHARPTRRSVGVISRLAPLDATSVCAVFCASPVRRFSVGKSVMPPGGTRKDENGVERVMLTDRRPSSRRPRPIGAMSPLASLARVPLRTRNCRLRRVVGEHAEQIVTRVGTPRRSPVSGRRPWTSFILAWPDSMYT